MTRRCVSVNGIKLTCHEHGFGNLYRDLGLRIGVAESRFAESESMGAHTVVRSRARDCSYSSQEFVRYLSLQQLNPEPPILPCTVPFWSSVPLGLFPSILDPSITTTPSMPLCKSLPSMSTMDSTRKCPSSTQPPRR